MLREQIVHRAEQNVTMGRWALIMLGDNGRIRCRRQREAEALRAGMGHCNSGGCTLGME